MGFVDKQRECR